MRKLQAAAPIPLLFAGVCEAASLAATISEVAVEWVGVPLPVVFAALAGAGVARSYTPPGNFFAALLATTGWAICGCILAPLLQAVFAMVGITLPVNGQAACALITAAGLPLALPILKEKAPEILRYWLDKLKGSKGGAP